jgi:hypothetical protein
MVTQMGFASGLCQRLPGFPGHRDDQCPDVIASRLFDEAIEYYNVVADRLGRVSESYPWTPEGGPKVVPVDDQCKEAVGWLKEAPEAEAEGLIALEKIAAEL